MDKKTSEKLDVGSEDFEKILDLLFLKNIQLTKR
jgi:hypothetical protein